MPYPDKLLADDEEVVRHLHPHWLTLFWPVVWLLVIVGLASFGVAVIPAGRQQGLLRLVVLAVAVLLLLVVVLPRFLRWLTTHYVITTHRLLFREGVLSRSGRDIALSRITDVSFETGILDRILGSGTLVVESPGEHGQVRLTEIPHVEHLQATLFQLVEEERVRATAHEWDEGG